MVTPMAKTYQFYLSANSTTANGYTTPPVTPPFMTMSKYSVGSCVNYLTSVRVVDRSGAERNGTARLAPLEGFGRAAQPGRRLRAFDGIERYGFPKESENIGAGIDRLSSRREAGGGRAAS
jgi:hypothetical protein